jgi:hypothetical protein
MAMANPNRNYRTLFREGRENCPPNPLCQELTDEELYALFHHYLRERAGGRVKGNWPRLPQHPIDKKLLKIFPANLTVYYPSLNFLTARQRPFPAPISAFPWANISANTTGNLPPISPASCHLQKTSDAHKNPSTQGAWPRVK